MKFIDKKVEIFHKLSMIIFALHLFIINNFYFQSSHFLTSKKCIESIAWNIIQ